MGGHGTMRVGHHGRRQICLIAGVWTSFLFAQIITGPAAASTQDLPSKEQGSNEEGRPQLRLGPAKWASGNAFTVALEFGSGEEMKSNQIRAEIVLSQSPWRFRKAQTVAGSSLKVSTRQRREKRIAPGGAEQNVAILSVAISSGKRTISSGTVAELLFTNEGPEVSAEIPLVIRSYEIAFPESPSTGQPPLEPPSAEPPANPAPTCFFFTH
jgi:hypothetical protein